MSQYRSVRLDSAPLPLSHVQEALYCLLHTLFFHRNTWSCSTPSEERYESEKINFVRDSSEKNDRVIREAIGKILPTLLREGEARLVFLFQSAGRTLEKWILPFHLRTPSSCPFAAYYDSFLTQLGNEPSVSSFSSEPVTCSISSTEETPGWFASLFSSDLFRFSL